MSTKPNQSNMNYRIRGCPPRRAALLAAFFVLVTAGACVHAGGAPAVALPRPDACPGAKWRRPYAALHAAAVHGHFAASGSIPPSRRVIIVPVQAGFADRLVGIVSGFLFGLVTGRAVFLAGGAGGSDVSLPRLELVFGQPHVNWTAPGDGSMVDMQPFLYGTLLRHGVDGSPLALPAGVAYVLQLNDDAGASKLFGQQNLRNVRVGAVCLQQLLSLVVLMLACRLAAVAAVAAAAAAAAAVVCDAWFGGGYRCTPTPRTCTGAATGGGRTCCTPTHTTPQNWQLQGSPPPRLCLRVPLTICLRLPPQRRRLWRPGRRCWTARTISWWVYRFALGTARLLRPQATTTTTRFWRRTCIFFAAPTPWRLSSPSAAPCKCTSSATVSACARRQFGALVLRSLQTPTPRWATSTAPGTPSRTRPVAGKLLTPTAHYKP